jgi:two-component system response regulator HydG
MVRQVAASEATLLIQGESGTGKEQLAKAIHFGGNRAGNPFVPIDMSSISVTVIESELFGHTKGAFTSASRDREGLLRAAGKGTVFLDEIGELPLNMQTRLLRVLQEREVRPVGSEKMLPIEARLIVATNKDLASAVKRKEFREDLYHRLNVVELTMPPLRERTEDISLLAQHFLLKYRDERPTVEGIADEALALLSEYNWPGNVRELENAILRAVVVGTSELIGISDLPLHVTRSSTEAAGLGPRRSAQAEACGSNATSADSLPATGTLASYEREAIITALEKSGGNRERAAKLLDIGVATLYRKLKRYHIT